MPNSTPSVNRSPSDAASLIEGLVEAGAGLRRRGIETLLTIMGRVGARFLDPLDPLAQEALERLPPEAGFSLPMAEQVLRGVAKEWTRERLDTLVTADFPDRRVLDEFTDAPSGSRLRALGGHFAFHVGAGNVPGVGATSLLHSLLVKTPLLLKPGLGDRALPELLLQGIGEEDPALARAAAVVYWPHGEGGALEELALREADRVVVYGGFETIARIRERIPIATPLVAYGHRVSMGAIAHEALDSVEKALQVVRDVACAIALFDRRGCVSPQLLWVEEGGVVSPLQFSEFLAEEMENLEGELPPGPSDPTVAAEMAQLRGLVEMRGAAGSGERLFTGKGGGWTLFFEPRKGEVQLCSGRAVYLHPISSLEALPERLAPYRGVLQTIALEAPPKRKEALAELLAIRGFTRITTFAEQPFPPAWWRHDGEGPLRTLVRWVEMEG